MRVAFRLSHDGTPQIEYADLKREAESGIQLSAPLDIAQAVRRIRSTKFPDLSVSGTAGSFFKNPTISHDEFLHLKSKYPELPGFETAQGIKVSIAWILDKVLGLRGYTKGNVRLFERQPLVIVAEHGATSADVDALATFVEQRVLEATGVTLEREVRMLAM